MIEKTLLIGSDVNGVARPLRTDTAGRLEVVNYDSGVNVRVYNNANIALTHDVTAILTFNTEVTDTDGMHSTSVSTGRLTCQVAGTYLVGGCVQFANHATGRRHLAIRLNGTTIIEVIQVPAVTAASLLVIGLSTLYTLGLNDYVELLAYQDSGGSLNVEYAAVYSPLFWAVKV